MININNYVVNDRNVNKTLVYKNTLTFYPIWADNYNNNWFKQNVCKKTVSPKST